MSKELLSAFDLGALMEAARWDGGVRIIIQGAMRAPVENGSVVLKASWRADIYDPAHPRQKKPLLTFVAETPQQLLADLANLSIEGNVKIRRDERSRTA